MDGAPISSYRTIRKAAVREIEAWLKPSSPARLSSSGNFAMFAAMRHASSLVSSLAVDRRQDAAGSGALSSDEPVVDKPQK